MRQKGQPRVGAEDCTINTSNVDKEIEKLKEEKTA